MRWTLMLSDKTRQPSSTLADAVSPAVSLHDKLPPSVHSQNIHYLLGDGDVRVLFITVLLLRNFPPNATYKRY